MYKFYVNRVNESLLDDLKVNREIVERTKQQAQRYEEVKGDEPALSSIQLDEFNKILLSYSSTLDDYVNKLESNTENMKSVGLLIYRYNLLSTVLNKLNFNTLNKLEKDKLITKLEELEPKIEELYRYATINDFTDLDSIKMIVDNFKAKTFRIVPVGAVKLKSISDIPVDIFGQIKEIERDNQILLEKAHLLTNKEQRTTQLFIDRVRLLERKIKSGNSNQKDLDDFKGLLLTFKSIIEGLEDKQYTYDNYIHSLDVLGTAPAQKLKRELNIQSNWDNTKLHNDIEKLINPPRLTAKQRREGLTEPVRVPPLVRTAPIDLIQPEEEFNPLPLQPLEPPPVAPPLNPFLLTNIPQPIQPSFIMPRKTFKQKIYEQKGKLKKPSTDIEYDMPQLTVNNENYEPEGATGTPEDTKKMGSLSREFQGEEGDDRFLEEAENRVGDPRGSLPLDYKQPRLQSKQSLLTADDEDTQRFVPKFPQSIRANPEEELKKATELLYGKYPMAKTLLPQLGINPEDMRTTEEKKEERKQLLKKGREILKQRIGEIKAKEAKFKEDKKVEVKAKVKQQLEELKKMVEERKPKLYQPKKLTDIAREKYLNENPDETFKTMKQLTSQRAQQRLARGDFMLINDINLFNAGKITEKQFIENNIGTTPLEALNSLDPFLVNKYVKTKEQQQQIGERVRGEKQKKQSELDIRQYNIEIKSDLEKVANKKLSSFLFEKKYNMTPAKARKSLEK